MKERRAQLEKKGEGIELRDLIDRVHPLLEAENGKIVAKSVERRANRFCYPLEITKGRRIHRLNSEAAYEGRQFEVIISNAGGNNSREVPVCKRSSFEKVDDRSIAFIGLTAYPESYNKWLLIIDGCVEATCT